ncbi:unnamed protein product [Brassicogethes aeneus]|uniref:RING-type E3 ubiquitin transferase n=1 Tax=Brassicogethes aeneus TaxID=1431903 RepID=A0A9P0B2E6_BRAAE|nr:unnamed protein product [Brassicogethes aeneus]
MNQFTDDLLTEKIFHCQICDELCTADIFLVRGKGNVCGRCFEERCGEEMKSRAELNTALILIIARLMLPCKFKSKGCNKRLESKSYSKHIGSCDFKTKQCPMKNVAACDWSGSNSEFGGHLLKKHKEHVIKGENNIFKVKTSLGVRFNVKILSDDFQSCLLKTSVVDDKFYYALNPLGQSEENMEYSVEHKSIETTNHSVIKTAGTLTKLNGIYNEQNLDKNPNATAVDIGLLNHLADEKNTISNEFNLNPKGVDEHILKLLECPVCMETMRAPIYLCSNGHSVCFSCKEELEQCPTCKGWWANIRNYFMENFTKNIKYPCKYKKSGCNEIVIESQLGKHEAKYPSRIYQCPMDCFETGNFEFILKHLKTNHKDMEFTTEIEDTFGSEETLKWMVFDSKLFRISYFGSDYCYWAVELVCSNENPNLYTFEVKILNHPLEWTLIKYSTCLEERKQRPLEKITDCTTYYFHHLIKFNVSIKRSN